MPKFRAV